MLLGQADMFVLPSQGDPLCGLTPSFPWSRQGRCDLPFHRPGACEWAGLTRDCMAEDEKVWDLSLA